MLRRHDLGEGQESDELQVSMLETIREYALERLAERGELPQLRERHAAHFLALAEQAAKELTGPEQESWLLRLGREHDILRVASNWAFDSQRWDFAARLG